MDNSLHTDRLNRTVAVVIAHAPDLDHAVDTLVAEFGFDATFCSLALMEGDTRAHQAMWLAVAALAIDSECLVAPSVGEPGPGA